MNTVTVSASKTYDVRIGAGLLATVGESVRTVTGSSACALVTDDTVDALYAAAVEADLTRAGLSVCKFVFPHGERSKNAATYVALLEFLAEHQLTRADCIVALGGGVVGDLAGFAAATYLRGVKLVQVPTTLLAMVDSSVGGKTAIDLSAGKNLAGAFYQPDLVLCDTDTLASLPREIFADGCAEVIKYGVLKEPEILTLMCQPQENLVEIITRCVTIKRDVVQADERDTGLRATLNLGHTVAHAIEKLTDYEVSHGRAVAIGLAVISCAAEKRGDCPPGTALTVMASLMRADLPVETEFTAEQLEAVMLSDKKRAGDTITLVIPTKIGQCELRKLPLGELRDYIAAGL
jgi:3-dehydroquinate synthase